MRDDPARDRLFEASNSPLEHAGSRLWMGNTLLIAIVLVAMTNAVSLERWAASHAPSWGVETLRLTSQVWAERMSMAGLDAPRNWVETRWNALRDAGWPRPAETATEDDGETGE